MVLFQKCLASPALKTNYTKEMLEPPLSWGFPGGSDGKESACNAGDLRSTLGLGRSPGEGKGKPLQYSCLENSMDRGAWWATIHGVAKSRTRLSKFDSMTRNIPSDYN